MNFQRVWILSDGKTGDLVQCRGVARALGVEADTRIVSPQKPFDWMMPWGPLPPNDHPEQSASPIAPPFPDLVISAGWRTLAYVRAIKKRQQEKVFTVFLKNPRSSADYIDLVWAPAHDRLSGPRVITSIASPHGFSPQVLGAEYGERPEFLKPLAKPLIGVLLGGESKDYHYSLEDCERLATSLRSLAQRGAGLAITPSRRSSDVLKNTVRQQLDGVDYYWWDEMQDNPYGFLLAQSDYFVVTADSANMVGEACVSGKPVFVFRPSGGSKKFDRLLAGFENYGATRPLPEQIDELIPWSYEPLYVARDIAREIKRRAQLLFEKRDLPNRHLE